MFYVYRSTTDKLGHHLNTVIEAGDTVFSVHYQGGRDWLLVCRAASKSNPRHPMHRTDGA